MNVEFYATRTGRVPVSEFIDSLSVKAQAKVARALDLLEEFGPALGEPHAKRLTAAPGIWELRVRLGSHNHRILFFQGKEDTLVLRHGFAKKRGRVSRRDVETAPGRMQDWKARRAR